MAAPQPLTPPQPRRPARHRQVAHQRLATPVRHRPHPTARAADQRGVGLHDKLQLTVDLVDLQQPHARQSEHGDADFVTLYTHLGPLCSQPWKSREYREVSGVSQRGHPTRPPRFIVKSLESLGFVTGDENAVLTVIDSARAGVAKPDRRIFAMALRELGVSAREAVHVGDSVRLDGNGARAAGIAFYHFDPHDVCDQRPEHVANLHALAVGATHS